MKHAAADEIFGRMMDLVTKEGHGQIAGGALSRFLTTQGPAATEQPPVLEGSGPGVQSNLSGNSDA